MLENALMETILPVSVLAQLAAAVVAIRLIRVTGKPLAWSLIAAALVAMTVRRIILLSLLLDGDATGVNFSSESLGLLISLLLLVGMVMTSGIFRSIQCARDKLDLAARRLQDASVAGKVALWEWDIITGTRKWSALVDDMLGFPPNGFPRSYRAWEARIHPNDLAGVQDAIRSNFETNAPYDVTYRIQRADNTYAWWHEVGHVNRDRNGSPVALAGVSIDITERMQREEEYATIIQTAMDGILIASARTGRLLDVNDSYCRLVGYTRAELLNMCIADLDLNESAAAISAHLQRIVRFGRDRFESRHRCKDGRSVDVAICIQSLANSNRICAFVSDITERKRSETAFRAHLYEIERFNQFATEREQRMIELKQQINLLTQELGRPPPFTSTPDAVVAATPVTFAQLSAPAAPPHLELPLRELLDTRQLQPLLESFSATAGIATAVVDLQGNTLVGANWQPICTSFHRVNERTWARCFESDTELASQNDEGKGYVLFQCRNGLQMAAAPILIENRPLGNFFISQFFLKPPNVEFFRRQAAEFGFDEKAYLDALARVPVLSRERLAPLLDFLMSCANLLSQAGEERLRERQRESATQLTTLALQRQREAALNLAQDAIESRRLLEVSEEALRQSRDMRARILDTVPQSVFWKDRNSVYLGCNQVFARAFNLASPQEIVGKTDFELTPFREEVEAYLADDREVMENNRPKRHIIERVHRPNDLIWADTTKLPLVDKDGQVYGVLVVYEDITEKKQAEEQMRQQDERHRFALETLGSGEWEMELASWTARRSIQHARIFGYEPPLTTWTFQEFLRHIVPEDLARVEKTVREGIRLGQDLDFECQILRHDGALRWIWVRGRHARDEQGKPLRLAGIVLDITNRKHEEALLQKSKVHLQLALIAIEEAIWDWVPADNRLFWSPRLFTMLGYAPDEFVPSIQTWESLLHPEDQPAARAMLQQCMDNLREDFQLDVRFRTQKGAWLWVLIRGRVLARGLHGEILRMAGTHNDISERKMNETLIRQQLEELQRWQTVMLGREQRTLELKHEINALLLRLHEPLRYASAEEGSGLDVPVSTEPLATQALPADKMSK